MKASAASSDTLSPNEVIISSPDVFHSGFVGVRAINWLANFIHVITRWLNFVEPQMSWPIAAKRHSKLELVGCLAIMRTRGQLVVKVAGAYGARASRSVWRSRRARCEVCVSIQKKSWSCGGSPPVDFKGNLFRMTLKFHEMEKERLISKVRGGKYFKIVIKL